MKPDDVFSQDVEPLPGNGRGEHKSSFPDSFSFSQTAETEQRAAPWMEAPDYTPSQQLEFLLAVIPTFLFFYFFFMHQSEMGAGTERSVMKVCVC